MTLATWTVAALLSLAVASPPESAGWKTRARLCVAFVVLAGLFVGVQFDADVDGYDSDLWTYLIMVERTAEGQSMLEVDPFTLAPPPLPAVSTLWLALGYLRRSFGLPLEWITRALTAASAILLTVAAGRLARRVLPVGHRFAAVVLFWLSLESWADIGLGRTLALSFVLYATEAALAPGPRHFAIGGALGAAFHIHLFGGVLGILAVLLGTACGGHWRRPILRDRALAIAAGLLVGAPCLLQALRTAGLPKTSAHLWQPGQFEALGLVWLDPRYILSPRQFPLLSLAAVGLWAHASPGTEAARRLARLGTALAGLLLLTPLYHGSVQIFGSWMTRRFPFLAFTWLSALLGTVALMRSESRFKLPYAALAMTILTCAFVPKVLDAQAPFSGRIEPFTFSRSAQREAWALRSQVKNQSMISADLLAYGLSAPTLAVAVALPPGHASQYVDFAEARRRVHRTLSRNSPACWRAFEDHYPGSHILVTPADRASVEQEIWRSRIESAPADIRRTLTDMGWLQPLSSGEFFVVDRLSRPPGKTDVDRGTLCD